VSSQSTPIESQPGRARNARPYTKIVATIGPTSEDRVGELLTAGMSIARINFSHGTPEDARRRIAKVAAE